MKLTISLLVCLQLCAQLLADPVPEPQRLPICRESDFFVTVDNGLNVYIDGVRVTAPLPNAKAWPIADKVRVPASARVIGIKGVDVGVVAGILASGAFSTTDGSWKCTNKLYHGWAGVTFNDAPWEAATVIGTHGVSPWGSIAGISSDAKWIWTSRNIYGPTSDKTVYCRKKRGCTQEPTTGPSCIKSCDGRPDGDYQSCKGCSVYASCVAEILYDQRPCALDDLLWDDNVRRCEFSSNSCTPVA